MSSQVPRGRFSLNTIYLRCSVLSFHRIYYRGLNDYLYYFGGFPTGVIVSYAPTAYSNYSGPYIGASPFRTKHLEFQGRLGVFSGPR